MTLFQVEQDVNIPDLNGRQDEALLLIQRFRTTPDSQSSLAVQELQVLTAAKRYGEIFNVTDRLQSDDTSGLSATDVALTRDAVLHEMSALIESRKQDAAE